MTALTADDIRVSTSSFNYNFGLGGNDSYNYTGSSNITLAGGQGDDHYIVALSSSSFSRMAVIFDNGYSSGDSLSVDTNYLTHANGFAYEVDGAHLYIGFEDYDSRPDPSEFTEEGVLILNWRTAGYEIETVTLGDTSFTSNTFVNAVFSSGRLQSVSAHDSDVGSLRFSVGANIVGATEFAAYLHSTEKDAFATAITSDYSSTSNGVYRFYNADTGAHFYTSDTNERDSIVENLDSFVFEGAPFGFAASGGDTEVYRFYNTDTATHLYTADTNERDFIQANVSSFNFEGVAYSASSSDTTSTMALYRFYNTQTATHFYTADENERSVIESTLDHFNFEGVAYYVDVI